jgi:hypothetical protein
LQRAFSNLAYWARTESAARAFKLRSIGLEKGRDMKIKAALIAVAAAGLLSSPPAHAVGCLSGAVAGGVAGHYAGHHAVIGAVGGCIAGHHLKKVQERQKLQQQAAPAPATPPATAPAQ